MLVRLLKSWVTSGTYDLIAYGSLPVLIACIRRDASYVLGELNAVAEYFQSEMDVYYALEDMFPFFSQAYGIAGTPTFLLIHQGRVLGTILGKEPVHELIKHASIILLDHQRPGSL